MVLKDNQMVICMRIFLVGLSKMAQGMETPTTKPVDLTLILRSHIVRRENQILQVVL